MRASIQLAQAYDGTPFGRRLQLRLDDACIALRPSQWRLAQLVVTVPLTLAIELTTSAPWLAAGMSLGTVRIGARMVLRLRRGRRDRMLLTMAVECARRLGTDLRAGMTAIAALRAMNDESRAQSPILRVLVTGAVTRVDMGATMDQALNSAVTDLTRGSTGAGASACRLLYIHIVLEAESGGDGSRLQRLADTLESGERVRARARATTTELRIAASTVPLLTAVAAVMLIAGDPVIGSAAVGLPEALILLSCVAATAVGVMGVRRITAA